MLLTVKYEIVAYTPIDFTYVDAVCYFCSHNYTAFLSYMNCMNCQILQFMNPAVQPIQELNCCLWLVTIYSKCWGMLFFHCAVHNDVHSYRWTRKARNAERYPCFDQYCNLKLCQKKSVSSTLCIPLTVCFPGPQQLNERVTTCFKPASQATNWPTNLTHSM